MILEKINKKSCTESGRLLVCDDVNDKFEVQESENNSAEISSVKSTCYIKNQLVQTTSSIVYTDAPTESKLLYIWIWSR